MLPDPRLDGPQSAPAATCLLQTLAACRTVYFCGLSKNAGKTVALVQVMREARAAGMQIAVTSIGRDGEAFDALYPDFAKPLIHVAAGDMVVTAEALLPAGCNIVQHFRIGSALGTIVAARAAGPCTVEVAGPSTVHGLRTVQAWVLAQGVDLFLVDGAIDRKAAALPDVSDGLVIASGAAVAEAMEDVLAETRCALDMLRVPADVPCSGQPALRFSPVFDDEESLRAAFAAHPEPLLTILVQGAVTERLVDFLLHARLLPRCRLVADCFAKVMITRRRWLDYQARGLHLTYLRSTPVLSLTVNPVAPGGAGFDAAAFLASMRAAVPEVPVFDVRSAQYRDSNTAGLTIS